MDNKVKTASAMGAAQEFQRNVNDTINVFSQEGVRAVENNAFTEFKTAIDNDQDVNNIRTQTNLEFASGITPAAPTVSVVDDEGFYNKDLYSSTIGVTQYDSLRTKVGLASDKSFTDWYNANGGYVPEGFEREAKMLLKEEKIKAVEKRMIDGEISQTDFLYQAYGKDLLKAQGVDLTNPNFWFQRYQAGDFSDITENYALMDNIYTSSLAAYQQELWFRDSQTAINNSLLGYVGQELSVEKAREIFKDTFDEVDDLIGDGQRVLDMYRAGMLTDRFNPIIYNKDGKAIFYLHYDGKLYRVADRGSPGAGTGFLAKADYYADGTLKKITVRNRNGVGETLQNFTRGIVDFAFGFVDLFGYAGAGLGDLAEGVTGQGFDLDKLSDYSIWRNKSLNSISWLSTDYNTSNNWVDKDGELNWQNISNGTAQAIGMIGSMLLVGYLTGGGAALGKLAASSVDDIVRTYADDLIRNIGDDIVIKNVDDLVKAAAQQADTYLYDDLIKVAADKGITITQKDIVASAMKLGVTKYQSATTAVRSNLNLAKQFLSLGDKSIDGIKWITRSLSSLRNGAPTQSLIQSGVSMQFETFRSLLPLATREFLMTAGALKARQEVNGLEDVDIVGESLKMAGLNLAVSMAFRGVLDKGPIDRHIEWLKKGLEKNGKTGGLFLSLITKTAGDKRLTSFVNWVDSVKLRHPFGFARVQSFMDIMENTLTAANNMSSESVFKKDGKIERTSYGENIANLFSSPQFVATNLHMHFTNMRGNYWMRNSQESGYLYGEVINSLGNIKKVVDDGRQDILRMIEVERLKNNDEGRKNASTLSLVLKEIDTEIANPEGDGITNRIKALGLLDDLTKFIDEVSGKETSKIREKLKVNLQEERIKNIKIQAETVALQYNASVKKFNEGIANAWGSGLFKKINIFMKNTFGDAKAVARFKDVFGDQRNFDEFILNGTTNMYEKFENDFRVLNNESNELLSQSQNEINKSLKVFGVLTEDKFENINGEQVKVSDPVLDQDIESAKGELNKYGLTADGVMFVKITANKFDNANTPQQTDNKTYDSFNKSLTSLANISAEDKSSRPLLIKINDGLFAIPSDELPGTVLKHMSIAEFIKQSYIFRYADNAETIKQSAINLLKVVGARTDDQNIKEIVNNIPDDIASREDYITKNTNVIYGELEKVFSKIADVGSGMTSGGKSLIINALKIFPETYLENSKLLIGIAKRTIDITNKVNDLVKNVQDTKKMNATQRKDFVAEFKNLLNKLNTLREDNPLELQYITNGFEDFKNLNAQLVGLSKKLGESSASQELSKTLIEGLFVNIKVENPELSDDLIRIVSERFVNAIIDYDDQYKIKLSSKGQSETLVKTIRELQSKLSRNSYQQLTSNPKLTNLINNGKLLTLTEAELISLLKTNDDRFDLATNKIDEETITSIKEAIYKAKEKIFGDIFVKKNNPYYSNMIVKMYNELKSKGIVTKELDTITAAELERTVITNFNLDEAHTKMYDIEDIIAKSIDAYNKVLDSAEEIPNKKIVINLNKAFGPTINRMIKSANNPTKQQQLSSYETFVNEDKLIEMLLGEKATDRVRRELKANKNLRETIDNKLILEFDLEPNGDIPLAVKQILKNLGWDADKLSTNSLYSIPGVFAEGTVVRDKIDTDGGFTLQALTTRVSELARLFNESKNKNLPEEQKPTRKNWIANLETNLTESSGGLEIVDDNHVVRNADNIVLANVDPKTILSSRTTIVSNYKSFITKFKQGIAASLTKQLQNIGTYGLGVPFSKDPEISRLYAIQKIVDTGYEIIKNRNKDTVYASVMTLTDSEYKDLNNSGIYDVEKLDGNNYSVTIRGDENDYLSNVTNYINKNKNAVNLKVLFGIRDLGGTTHIQKGAYQLSFFDKLYTNFNLENEERAFFIDKMNGTFDLSKFNFDFTNNTKKAIVNLFNGKTIKQIRNLKDDLEKNATYILLKNNILASKELSDVIKTILVDNNIGDLKLNFLSNSKSRRAISKSIINYYDNLENNMARDKALEKALVDFRNFLREPNINISKADYIKTNIEPNAFRSTNYREAIEVDNEWADRITVQDIARFIDEEKIVYDDVSRSDRSNGLNYIQKNMYADILEALSIGSQGLEPSKFLFGLSSNGMLEMPEEAYLELQKVLYELIPSSKISVVRSLFEKYDAIRSQQRNIVSVQKRIPAESEKVSGEVSDNKFQITNQDNENVKAAKNRINDMAAANSSYRPYKLSNLKGPAETSKINQLFSEMISRDYNEVSNPASRLLPDFRNYKQTGKLFNNISSFAGTMISKIRGLNINDPEIYKNKSTIAKFADTALRIYFYSTGLDFSNQYAKYVIIDEAGEINDIANIYSKGFNEYKDLMVLASKINKTSKELADGKKYYVVELNKNMISSEAGFGDINNLRMFELTDENLTKLQTYTLNYALNEFDMKANAEDKQRVLTIADDKEREIEKINIVMKKNLSSLDRNKLQKNVITKTFRLFNPNISDKELNNLYNRVFKSSYVYRVDTPEMTLNQEALLNHIDLLGEYTQDQKNYLYQKFNEVFKYGFTNDSMPDGVKQLLLENKKIINNEIKTNILNVFKNNGVQGKEAFIKSKETLRLFNLVRDAYDSQDNELLKNSIQTLKTFLSVNNIKPDMQVNAYFNMMFESLSNFLLVNSSNLKTTVARMLTNPYDDLVISSEAEDFGVLKQGILIKSNDEQLNIKAQVNDVLNKDIYISDVENIYLKEGTKLFNLNKDNPLGFQFTFIKVNGKEGKTKDITKVNIELMKKFFNDPSIENKTKLYESLNATKYNMFLPMYINDGKSYKLISTDELLKQFTYDEKDPNNFYSKYFKGEKGIEKVFNEYKKVILDLKAKGLINDEYNSLADVKAAINQSIKLQKSDLNLENDSLVLGFNNKHDINIIKNYANITEGAKIFDPLVQQAKWFDVLQDGIKETNTNKYLKQKNLKAATETFNEGKKSVGDAHDAEYDSLATLFVFYNLLNKKINNLNYRTNFKNDIDSITKEFYGDNLIKFKPKLKNIAYLGDEASFSKEVNKFIDESFIDETSKNFINAVRESLSPEYNEIRKGLDKNLAEFKLIENYYLTRNELLSNRRAADKYSEYEVDIPNETRKLLDRMQDGEYLRPASLIEFMIKRIGYNDRTYEEMYNAIANNPKEFKMHMGTLQKFLQLGKGQNYFALLDRVFTSDLADAVDAIEKNLKTNADFSIEETEAFAYIKGNLSNFESIDNEGLSGRSTDKFASLLGKFIDDPEYDGFRRSITKANVAWKFNNVLNSLEETFDFSSLGNEQKKFLRSALRNLYNVDSTYEDKEFNDIDIVETWNNATDYFEDFTKDPNQHFTVGRNGLYKQATQYSAGQQAKVIRGFGQSGRIVDDTTVEAGTVYVSQDVFKNHFKIQDKRSDIGLIISAMKNRYGLKNDDSLFVMTTRHPNLLAENQHVIKIEVLDTKERNVVALDKDLARSKYQLDFDGDDLVIYSPDEYLQKFGNTFHKYTNASFNLFTEVMKEAYNKKLSDKSNSFGTYLITLKSKLNYEKIFNADRLQEDYQKIKDSNYKSYKILEDKAREDVNNIIKKYNIVDPKLVDNKELIDEVLKDLWFNIENISYRDIKNDFKVYTLNPNAFSNSNGLKFRKEIRDNIQYIQNIKFLNFPERMFADTALGEYRNKLGKTRVNVETEDSLTDIFNFSNFVITDDTKSLMIGNSKAFATILNSKLKSNKEIESIIGKEVYQHLIEKTEKLVDSTLSDKQIFDRLLDSFQIITLYSSRNNNFKNEYGKFLNEFKNSLSSEQITDERNKFLHNYFASRLTKDEIQKLGLRDINNFYNEIGKVKQVYQQIQNRMKPFKDTFIFENDSQVADLINQLVYQNKTMATGIGKGTNNIDEYNDYVDGKILVYVNNKLSNRITEDQFVFTKKSQDTIKYGAVYKEKFNSTKERADKEKAISKDPANKIFEVNEDTNTIFYYTKYNVSAGTKVIVPNTNIKGTYAANSETFSVDLLNQLPANFDNKIKGSIDLITKETNMRGKFVGTYASPNIKYTYYDDKGNEVSGKDKKKVSFYIIETPLKNQLYQESWNQKSKEQRIATLTKNKTLQNLTGIFVSGADVYTLTNTGTIDEPNFKIKIDNELEQVISVMEETLLNKSFFSSNAKTKHNLLRLMTINDLAKIPTKDLNNIFNEIVYNPQFAESYLNKAIIKYFGSTKAFSERLAKTNNGLKIALFSADINNLFKETTTKVKADEQVQVMEGKGRSAYDRLVSNINDSLADVSSRQLGGLGASATTARQTTGEEITVKDNSYYPMLGYINKLLEVGKTIIAEGTNEFKPRVTFLKPKDAQDATKYNYASKHIGYRGSSDTNFRPLDYNQINKTSIDQRLTNAKTEKEIPEQITLMSGLGIVPQDLNLNTSDSSNAGYLKEAYLNKTNPSYIDVQLTERIESDKLKLLMAVISRAGKFKTNLQRYYAAGYANDNVKFNQTNKIVRSSSQEPIIIDADYGSDIVRLKDYESAIIRSGSIDNYYDLLDMNQDNLPKYLFEIYNSNKGIIDKPKEKPIDTIDYVDLRNYELDRPVISKAEMDKLFETNLDDEVGSKYEDKVVEYNTKYSKHSGTFGIGATMEKKFGYDPLSSSGIKIDSEEGFIANDIVVSNRKDKAFNQYNLMREVDALYKIANGTGQVDRINKYMFVKGTLNYLDNVEKRIKSLREAGVSDKNVISELANLEIQKSTALKELGLTKEEALRFLENTKTYAGPLVDKADELVNSFAYQQKEYLTLNGSPVDNIYLMLLPSIPKGKDMQFVNYFKQNVLNKQNEFVAPTQNLLTYNFFETMNDISKLIAEEKAYFNLGKRMRENGLMANKEIVEETQNLIDTVLDNVLASENYPTRRLQDQQFALIEQIDSINRLLENGKSANKNDSFTSVMVNAYKDLDNFLRLKGISNSEAEAGRRISNATQSNEYLKILKAYEFRDDMLAAIVKTYGADLSPIYDRIKSIADSRGYALTDRFGRTLSDKFENYKMLTNLNLEYLIKGVQYYSPYNGGYKNNVVLDILGGDIFFTNKSFADVLDKVEYNKKVPGKVVKALQNVGAITTQLIMSNPFQLMSRIFKWTAGDLGFGMITDWKTPLKLPDAYKEIRAFLSSNGQSISEDFRDWLKHYPVDPKNLDFNLLLNDIETAEKTGQLFKNAYFDKTQKAGYWQSMFVRYAMFKAVKESFENGKPNYGSSYYQKSMIDNMKDVYDSEGKLIQSAEGRKAGYIVSQTLGSTLDFPELSKKINGVFVFTTYPLSLIRWARNEFSSLGTIAKDLYLGSAGEKESAFRNLAVKGLGIAGIYTVLSLMYSAIGAIFDVDEEEIEEWKEEQATPEFIKMLFQGSPVMDKYNTINPLRQIQEKTITPFKEGFEEAPGGEGLLRGSFKFLLENFGNLNPVFKTTLEVLTGYDVIERNVIPVREYNDTFDNFYRKMAGFVIGAAGARAMINYKNDIAPYQTDDNLVNKVIDGASRAIDAEFGNSKAYKGDVKNFYKAKQLINSYRFDEELIPTITKAKLPDTPYDIVTKELRSAMMQDVPTNKVYDIIIAYAQAGVDLKTIRSALRNLSLSETIERMPNRDDVLSALSPKELASVEKALLFESNMFPWLSYYQDVISNMITAEGSNNKRYFPNYYNKQNYYNNYRPSIRNPYLNLYRNKLYLKDPFKAYQSAWFELNPEYKRQMEE